MAVNQLFLSETKMIPEKDRVFPWHESQVGRKRRRIRSRREKDEGVLNSIQVAVSQWRPLLANNKVRNVVMMNGFYWVALSGAQMTLLPLILTDTNGLAMSPTSVGEIYMGMSLVQVFGNPTVAKYIDKIGKVPGIVTGCSLLSASMFTLPFCTEIEQVAATLGVWALGSTMLSTAPTAYISDHVRDDQRAQAIALLRTAGDIGLLVGASSTGAVADVFDMDVAVHSSASLLLLATTWFSIRRWLDWQQSKRLQ
jgi:predicted MFS family arabinose efflux permease